MLRFMFLVHDICDGDDMYDLASRFQNFLLNWVGNVMFWSCVDLTSHGICVKEIAVSSAFA